MIWHRWGAGPPVVLLHGGYGSWTHWIRNIHALAARYSVFAADLPGMGESDLVPEPHDGHSIARIVARAIDRVVPHHERYHLVGFSFGGVLGGPIGVLHEDRVRSLTLVGAGGHPDRRPLIELRAWRHATDDTARDAIHRENLARLMLADSQKIDSLAVWLQSENARRGRLKSRPISRTPLLAEALPAVKAPVAVIFGELDATSYPSLDERIERLRSLCPELQSRVIPGAGHWVQYEAANAFNAALLEVMTKLDQPNP